ncbi:diguanylate cyclase [Desulfuromonas acetoxidans]|uniref:diguanylate cyclase n=1 Tax=Desulfuromonas acetoxidans (strain DSM 684 / 11070) TaxID=281689 RepID=Q1JYF1_DESA6|nr:diguanylate cyclase [Desulfuromonas acetoxidans]EAT15255.1 diguanylate cyclase [Desulfuromonas acetoxidans DSM 684]MBF0645359.1 diguanylate cyclase [Desulfuromonas acetoxidans]NVD23439.1 diguanylate cyclase [Desulfuromonas acetoxidans]NVE15320.1 diguanylate cyclase [Desulfuromonas acetoxidans]
MGPGILVVAQSAATRQTIIDALKDTSPFTRYLETNSGREGLEIVAKDPIDVIVCGLKLYQMSGLELLRNMQQDEELCDIPFIVLADDNRTKTKIELLEQGASDYIVQPVDIGELVARIKVQLKVKTLQDNLKRSNRLLLNLSSTDSLTQLYNRRVLMRTLRKEFQRQVRTEESFSLLMVDVDHFKNINDRYGHLNGDTVLINLARMLRSYLRPYDVPTRFGGEEFALVLPNTNMECAREVAERLRLAAKELRFSGEIRDLEITISIGVATCPADGVESEDDLLKLTDDALYAAKSAGRDQVVCATELPTNQDCETSDIA